MSESNRRPDASPGDAVEEWWGDTSPYDAEWVAGAEEHLRDAAAEKAARPEVKDADGNVVEAGKPAAAWDAEYAASEIMDALRVHIEKGQHLWIYDPQVGHFTDDRNGRVTQLVQRAVWLLVSEWKPSKARGDGTMKYAPALAGTVLHYMRFQHPSPRDPSEPGDMWKVGFKNGVLDIRDEQDDLWKHHPDHGLTRVIPWAFDPGAECPRFLREVKRIIPDEGSRSLFQRVCGAALTELPPPQEMVVLEGEGGTGKTQLLEVLRGIVGGDNAVALSPSDIGKSQFQLQFLQGAAINIPGDLSVMKTDDTANFKQALGGGWITAEVKGSNTQKKFISRAVWVGATNELPKAGIDKSYGFFRRWLPIPVTPEPVESAGITPVLDYGLSLLREHGEAPGIINWMIEGARDWIKRGMKLDPPQEVLNRRESWRTAGDIPSIYVTARLRKKPGAWCLRKDLREDWKRFLDDYLSEDADPKSRPGEKRLYEAVRTRFPGSRAGEVPSGTRAGFPDICFLEKGHKEPTPNDEDVLW